MSEPEPPAATPRAPSSLPLDGVDGGEIAPPLAAEPASPEPARVPAPPPPDTAAGPLASFLLALAGVFTFAFVQTIVMLVLVTIDALRQDDPPSDLMDHLFANMGWSFSISTLAAVPLCLALAVGGLYLLARRRGQAPWSAMARHLGLGPPRVGPLVLWTAATAVFVYLFGIVGDYFERPPLPEFMVDFHATAGSVWLLGAAVVVAAPLIEETIFRGVLLPAFRPLRHGTFWGLILSAAFWAAIHAQYDLFDMTAIFLLGLLFGGARLHSRSLWAPVLLHAAFNLYAVFQLLDALGPVP